jgi:cytoskeleton-associated protein 5
MCRWAGKALVMTQLANVKPILLTEIETDFDSCTGKPVQLRWRRSEPKPVRTNEVEDGQQSGNGAGANAGASNNDVADPADVEFEYIDPWTLADPVDITPRMPKDFFAKCEEKKWQERKEAVDALLLILQKTPRLVKDVDIYHELLGTLKKLVAKDSNVNVMMVAAKCIACIASGLRKDFSKHAVNCIEPCMERFKEKKQNIVDAMREACDAIYPSTNLEVLQETCCTLLAHKTPVVRQQVALFLAKCFAMSDLTSLPKKLLKLYLPPLLKNLSDADVTVRDASAEALGALYKLLGEKIFSSNAGEIEQLKMDKIKEFGDKCVLLNARGEPRAQPNKPAAAVKTADPAPTTVAKKPTITKPVMDAKTAVNGKPAANGSAAPVKKVVKGGGAAEKKPPAEEPDLSGDVVDERAVELFGAECINGLVSNNWKERQTAIETIANAIKRMVPEDAPVQIIVRTIAAKKPGLRDTHFQCLKMRLDVLAQVADAGFKFSQRSASYCLAEVADKLGDPKQTQLAREVMSRVADHCTLAYVCRECMPLVLVQGKNPKNQETILVWLTQAIREFGFAGMDVKALIAELKGALANQNPTVRGAAIQCIATCNLYLPQFKTFFEQEKPILVKEIMNAIEQVWIYF